MDAINPKAVVGQSPRAVFRRLSADKGGVLLHLESAEYFGLNEVGCLLWETLGADGATELELVASVKRVYPDAPDDAVQHVEEFVQALRERDLVTVRASS